MVIHAYTLDLADDPALVAAYRHHHERIWPEVADALRTVGIRGLQIYLRGTRLFMCVEAVDGFDADRDLARYAALPRVPEWEALMQTFQRQLPGAREGEWWQPMECLFDLAAQPEGRRRDG